MQRPTGTRRRPPPSSDIKYLNWAEELGTKSNCVRRRVGAVLVAKQGVIAKAWNGVSARYRSCLEAGCPRCKRGGRVGTGYDSCICLHAEQRALALAARAGKSVRGATLYVSLRPCLACLNLAIEAGVLRVVYKGHWVYDRLLESRYNRLASRLRDFECVE